MKSARKKYDQTESIKFYNERIKQIPAERAKFSHYVSLIKPNARELHLLQWETRKPEVSSSADEEGNINNEEMDMFETEFRKTNQQLLDARSEFEALQAAQATKRSQIEKLSELPQPVQRDTTYLFDDKYSYRVTNSASTSSSNGLPKSSLMKLAFGLKSVETNANSSSTNNLPPPPPPSSSSSSSSSFGKIKTGEVVKLETSIKQETERIIGHSNEFQQYLHQIKEHLSKTMDNANISLGSDRSDIIKLVEENDSLDQQCYYSVLDLLKLRATIMLAQREEFEELDAINKEKHACTAKEERVMERLRKDISAMRESLQDEMNELEEEFQNKNSELTAKIDHFRMKQMELMSRNAAIKSLEMVTKLEHQLQLAQAKSERLRQRHALEMEGYHNEMVILRQRLEKVARHNQAAAGGGGGGGGGGAGGGGAGDMFFGSRGGIHYSGHPTGGTSYAYARGGGGMMTTARSNMRDQLLNLHTATPGVIDFYQRHAHLLSQKHLRLPPGVLLSQGGTRREGYSPRSAGDGMISPLSGQSLNNTSSASERNELGSSSERNERSSNVSFSVTPNSSSSRSAIVNAVKDSSSSRSAIVNAISSSSRSANVNAAKDHTKKR